MDIERGEITLLIKMFYLCKQFYLMIYIRKLAEYRKVFLFKDVCFYFRLFDTNTIKHIFAEKLFTYELHIHRTEIIPQHNFWLYLYWKLNDRRRPWGEFNNPKTLSIEIRGVNTAFLQTPHPNLMMIHYCPAVFLLFPI